MAKISCVYFPNVRGHDAKENYERLHLAYCRKSSWKGELKQCEFNGLHRIPIPEFEYHLETCSDRFLVESFKNKIDSIRVEKFEKKNSDSGQATEHAKRVRKITPEIGAVNDLYQNVEILIN